MNFLGITASENESEVSPLPRDKSDGTGFSFLQYAGRLAPCFYERAEGKIKKTRTRMKDTKKGEEEEPSGRSTGSNCKRRFVPTAKAKIAKTRVKRSFLQT